MMSLYVPFFVIYDGHLQAIAPDRIRRRRRMLSTASPGRQNSEARDKDKTGTTMSPENNTGPQVVAMQQLASRVSLEAEGKGFEPSTGFPAPDFESGR